MPANIRKIIVQVDETRQEMGQPVNPPTRRAVAMAVIANPYAGRYSENLDELINIGEELGALLGQKAVKALGIAPGSAQSYGKAAIVEMWKGAMAGLEAVSFQCVPCMIEVTGDTARSRVQTQEILKPKDGPTRHVGGLYEDELRKVDGRWQFTRRVFRIVAEHLSQGSWAWPRY